MKLSIIIPVYNEEKFIGEIVKKTILADFGVEKEIIVVDDGSTDKTKEILNALSTDKKIIVLDHKKNLGKGSAIKTGIGRANGDYIAIQDADLEYEPGEIKKMLEKMGADVAAVYGNRGVKHWPKRGFHYVIGAKILTWLVDLFFFAHIADLYTGHKLFRTEILKSLPLKSHGFEFEAEVTCELLKRSGKIIEVPILYAPRNKNEGKKIRLVDAFIGAWTILKCRFG